MAIPLSGADWLECLEIESRGGYRNKLRPLRDLSRYLCFGSSSYNITRWIRYQQEMHRPTTAFPTILLHVSSMWRSLANLPMAILKTVNIAQAIQFGSAECRNTVRVEHGIRFDGFALAQSILEELSVRFLLRSVLRLMVPLILACLALVWFFHIT